MVAIDANARFYLLPREAAQLLAIGEKKLSQLTRSGVIPSIRIGVRGTRYSRLALIAWAEQQAVVPNREPAMDAIYATELETSGV